MDVGDSWCWSHTHVSEGARPKVSSWQGGSAVAPSAGPACTFIRVCSLPPILEDGLFLRPRELGVAPALMCCLDVCPKTGPSAAGPGVDLGAHLGHPSRLQLCWVGSRRRQGPGAPCPLVSRALCLHTDISGSGSLRCSAGGWGSGQVWGSQHHQGMLGSGLFGSLSGQPHPLPSSTPELEAFPSLNKRQSPGFSHGLPHGSWQVSGEARGTGA